MKPRDRILTLHFTDGTKLSFDFPEQTANMVAKAVKLDEILKGDHLLIEADGSLMVFPTVNIKYLQFTPVNGLNLEDLKLPRNAIVGATISG